MNILDRINGPFLKIHKQNNFFIAKIEENSLSAEKDFLMIFSNASIKVLLVTLRISFTAIDESHLQ